MPLEVKGTSLFATREFVKNTFANRYDEWFSTLDKEAQKSFNTPLAAAWYPADTCFVQPMASICDLFFDGQTRGAWEVGRYSADVALSGVYRVFIKLGTARWMVGRAQKVLDLYYRPIETAVSTEGDKRIILTIGGLHDPRSLGETRIGGWIERAAEMSRADITKVHVDHSRARSQTATIALSD